jgi:hypothetical protein
MPLSKRNRSNVVPCSRTRAAILAVEQGLHLGWAVGRLDEQRPFHELHRGEDVLRDEAHAFEPGEAGLHLAVATVLVAGGGAPFAQSRKETIHMSNFVVGGAVGEPKLTTESAEVGKRVGVARLSRNGLALDLDGAQVGRDLFVELGQGAPPLTTWTLWSGTKASRPHPCFRDLTSLAATSE